MSNIPTSWKSKRWRARVPPTLTLARRQLRGGLQGFSVFIACVALGVMVITAVGTLTDSLRSGLERQGRTILGGDILLSRMHTRAPAEERAILDALATTSETANMRSTARRPDGREQTLIELKGVDAAYPMIGKVDLVLGRGAHDFRAAIESSLGAVVDPILLERLELKLGDKIKIGTAEVTLNAVIEKLPGGISDRLTYGPRILVSLATLQATGLLRPGALVRWRYSLKLPGSQITAAALRDTRETLKKTLSDRGFTIADRRDPSPQIRRALERLRQFLTLIGLTSLLVGGVGVANAVSTFIDKNRKTIATLKSVGATSAQVFAIFLTQVLTMAVIGVAIGLIGGFATPVLINWLYGDTLPIRIEPSVSTLTIATALIYGTLVSLLFSVWPLGQAGRMSAAVLFRDEVANETSWPSFAIFALTFALAAALILFAVFSSDQTKLAIYFCLSVAVAFAIFIALGVALTKLARAIPRPRQPELAIALSNLGAPGGLTRSVVLSLGMGLSVLVAVSLADHSLVREMEQHLPETSPDYFVLDIPRGAISDFRKTVTTGIPNSSIKNAPMLRGRLVKLNGRPVEQISAPSDAQWVLNGDRGLTYADEVPDGSKLKDGTWWPKNYAGEPLVSFEADLADLLDLKIGDTLTVNILGRDVTARIANLRDVNWDSLAINFVMVFSPNTLKDAPANSLATLKFPAGTSLADEARLARELASAYPTLTLIRVKEAINTFAAVFAKMMMAVRAAGFITLLAGAIVLAGALATAHRRRIREAVILTTLGATRARILAAHIAEYLLVALATAGFSIALGAAAAWLVLTQVMDTPAIFSISAITLAVALAVGLVLVFGGLGTWTVLRARPMPHLRAD